ncbi:jg21699 [Pararge aegeria aegeria]|uniref:Jg21699 protein n=1 Tax=Pararge aegeria aegeria TaxID=348720 RepID=A0A8S4SIU6_9NEOP|nr:jg21699 [Pararge aegeria aegeria]
MHLCVLDVYSLKEDHLSRVVAGRAYGGSEGMRSDWDSRDKGSGTGFASCTCRMSCGFLPLPRPPPATQRVKTLQGWYLSKLLLKNRLCEKLNNDGIIMSEKKILKKHVHCILGHNLLHRLAE